MNQPPTDGRYALFPDRFASAAVMSPDPNKAWIEGPGPTKSTYFLFGLTTNSAADLAFLDRSWLQPAAVRIASGSFTAKFDPSQRAYVLEPQTPGTANPKRKVDLTLEASDQSPAVNPAFVVKDWGDSPAIVKLRDRKLPPDSVRTGLVHRLDGTDLVVWVRTLASFGGLR